MRANACARDIGGEDGGLFPCARICGMREFRERGPPLGGGGFFRARGETACRASRLAGCCASAKAAQGCEAEPKLARPPETNVSMRKYAYPGICPPARCPNGFFQEKARKPLDEDIGAWYDTVKGVRLFLLLVRLSAALRVPCLFWDRLLRDCVKPLIGQGRRWLSQVEDARLRCVNQRFLANAGLAADADRGSEGRIYPAATTG